MSRNTAWRVAAANHLELVRNEQRDIGAAPVKSKDRYVLLEWPRLDLAAKLVIEHRGEWDGSQYYMLPPAAEALQHDHLLAAVILYRALLDDMLARARSKAYSHAARYLKKLDALVEWI